MRTRREPVKDLRHFFFGVIAKRHPSPKTRARTNSKENYKLNIV